VSENVTAPAAQIANDLHAVIVEEGGCDEFNQPEKYGVPETYHVLFRAKMRIYREALVLFVLINKAKEDQKYEPVLRSYEAIVLPPSPTIDGMTKLEALNGAMHRFSDLLKGYRESPDPQYFSWVESWFAGIGDDQLNVTYMTLFSTYWINSWLAVWRSVDQLTPS